MIMRGDKAHEAGRLLTERLAGPSSLWAVAAGPFPPCGLGAMSTFGAGPRR